MLARLDWSLKRGWPIPLLRADEPELFHILQVLRYTASDRPRPALVEPLRRLTADVRRRHRDDRQALKEASDELAHVLREYAHPKFVPLLLEWARSDDHASSEHAGEMLKELTGHSPRDEPDAWGRWWKRARPLLEADYDLRRPDGRREWYHAYRQGDDATRHLLLRLWSLEPALDEAALVRESGGEGGDVAKAVLGRLWQERRLTDTTKGAIVEKFLSVRLEEVPGQPAERVRHLRVIAERHFPFPPEARAYWRSGFAIGCGSEPKLGDSFNTTDLGEGAGPLTLGTMRGSSPPGTPQAKAILEVWLAPRVGEEAGAWGREWKLGPIRLRAAK